VTDERSFPEAWVPTKAGDSVEGDFVRLVSGYGKSGDVCPVVVLCDADGVEHAVWLWHLVLRSDFAKLRPELGEHVRVDYLGTAESAAGRRYHRYAVETNRPTQLGWDDLDDLHTKPINSDDEAPF
jgi:hypothetical protein